MTGSARHYDEQSLEAVCRVIHERWDVRPTAILCLGDVEPSSAPTVFVGSGCRSAVRMLNP